MHSCPSFPSKVFTLKKARGGIIKGLSSELAEKRPKIWVTDKAKEKKNAKAETTRHAEKRERRRQARKKGILFYHRHAVRFYFASILGDHSFFLHAWHVTYFAVFREPRICIARVVDP